MPNLTSRVQTLGALPGMTPAVLFPAAACLLLPAAGLGVAMVSGAVAAGGWRSYGVLVVNHLLTLGWGTLVALGALHQMLPAFLGVSSKPGRSTAAHFAFTFAAFLVVLTGFATASPSWVAAGGVSLVASVGAFWWIVARLIARRRRWPPAATGVVASLGHLSLAVLWGALMALNWNFQFWPALYTPLGLGTHAAVGLVGWFVQLVVAVSYYLLPRFTGVRTVPERAVLPLLAALNTSVVLFVLAAAFRAPVLARLGAAVLAAAALAYVADLTRFLRGARQQVPDLTNWHWWAIAAQTVLAASVGLLWAAGLLRAEGSRLAAATAVLVLCGWVSLAIMGQLYKITPFLMWYYRYARGLSAYDVPRLPAPYFPRWGVLAFALAVSGSTGLPAAVFLGTVRLAPWLGGLFAAGCVVYAVGMAFSWMASVLAHPPQPVRHA